MKYRESKLFIYATLGLLAVNCRDSSTGPGLPIDNHEKVTITQGVWGNVWFWEGNFMPTTGGSSHGTVTPVARELFVYEPTRFDSAVIAVGVQGGGFYDSILTKPVTKLQSDNSGFFQIELPAGKYSFFVKEGSFYYANESDSQGYMLSTIVTTNSVTKRQIDINYRAGY
jgi:hypothetical protein